MKHKLLDFEDIPLQGLGRGYRIKPYYMSDKLCPNCGGIDLSLNSSYTPLICGDCQWNGKMSELITKNDLRKMKLNKLNNIEDYES